MESSFASCKVFPFCKSAPSNTSLHQHLVYRSLGIFHVVLASHLSLSFQYVNISIVPPSQLSLRNSSFKLHYGESPCFHFSTPLPPSFFVNTTLNVETYITLKIFTFQFLVIFHSFMNPPLSAWFCRTAYYS